jgi:hypothetical protein
MVGFNRLWSWYACVRFVEFLVVHKDGAKFSHGSEQIFFSELMFKKRQFVPLF